MRSSKLKVKKKQGRKTRQIRVDNAADKLVAEGLAADRLCQIKKAYSVYYRELLLQGKHAQRATGVGFWSPSSADQMFKLFKIIGLSRFSSFVDLGSGDGVVTAVASIFTKATGIEFDPALCRKSEEVTSSLGLCCSFVCSDFLKEDLSRHDIVFINPDDYFYKLERKLSSGFRGTLIVVDHLYRPLHLPLKKEVCVDGQRFLLYKV